MILNTELSFERFQRKVDGDQQSVGMIYCSAVATFKFSGKENGLTVNPH
jgi:hypothetical protein